MVQWIFVLPVATGLNLDAHLRKSRPPDVFGATQPPDVSEAAAELRQLLSTDEDEPGMDRAVAAIRGAQRCVIFTGAGISAASGVRTFRGAGGLWSSLAGRAALIWGGTRIGWRWTPGLVWQRFVEDFYRPIAAAEPNDGHRALVELQRRHFGGTELNEGLCKFITVSGRQPPPKYAP